MKQILIVAMLAVVALASAALAGDRKPAILFGSLRGPSQAGIDLTCFKELCDKGYQVDYTMNASELTWDRIRHYNVLVLYATTGKPDFPKLVTRFLEAGGGVLLICADHTIPTRSLVPDLEKPLDVRMPSECIEETDRARLGALTQASRAVPIAWTENVAPSPISEGVKGMWYPPGMTSPVVPGKEWQVVVRASATARSKPSRWLDTATADELNSVFWRKTPESAPAFVVLRPFKAGRVVLINQWRQFTVGAGTRFIYNREVLSKGIDGKPSDMGRLIENSYNWLAEPSLASGAVGGYTTKPETLVPPNLRPNARQQFEYTFWYWEYQVAEWHRPPQYAPVFKGLIGARTALSSGKGTVAEYAAAARKAGLDFVIFLEDFATLSREDLRTLEAECKKHGNERLALIPGYSIPTNIGCRLMLIGTNPVYPPEDVRTGPDKKVFDLQPTDPKTGKFRGYNGPSFGWLLGTWHTSTRDAGYYHLTGDPSWMQMYDLRLYALVALRYYSGGKLIEDVSDQYPITAQGTLPGQPVCVNEVSSPDELIREVASGNALTYAQARSLDRLMPDALRWTGQYDGLNPFISDGPIIHAWPFCYRVMTAGSENFVVAPNVMASGIDVSAEKGLKEVRIYDGARLFRRFKLGGVKSWREMLLLNGTIQRNLVLVAEDTAGGRAISNPRRCWKSGGRQPVFCSDHVNDCKSGGMLFGRGPVEMLTHWPPALPEQIAGGTWDGGPPGSVPLTTFQASRPSLQSDVGNEDGAWFANIPLLEYSDEGAVAATSWQKRVYDQKRLERVVNPWHTFGPLGGPSKLMDFRLRYREVIPPTVGVPEYGWAAPGIREGMNASLFRQEITFKKDLTVKRLTLIYNGHPPTTQPAMIAWGRNFDKAEKVTDLMKCHEKVKLAPGDWFACFSPKLSSTQMFIVRKQPIMFEVRGNYQFVFADMADPKVKAGDTYAWELFATCAPVSTDIPTIEAVLARYRYLAAPEGLKLIRGKRLPAPGMFEVAPVGGAVELSVPRPKTPLGITLPLRVNNLNRNWTAGLWQKSGYVKGDYGTGQNRYRPMGMDDDGFAYVPLYVEKADVTHVVAGHPVIASGDGKDLFIQVTLLRDNPWQWHVAVNNPTDKPIRTTLAKGMDLPELILPEGPITIAPGEYRVVR